MSRQSPVDILDDGRVNQINTSNWTASEVVAYLTNSAEDMSFSDYARKHIEKLIKRGQERTSRNYKWALNHMERFAHTDNIMFSRLTSSFLNRWIESLSETNRCKEQYPVCIREIYKAAMKEYNDEEQGIAKLKNPWCNVVIPRSDTFQKNVLFRQVCCVSSLMSSQTEADLPILLWNSVRTLLLYLSACVV